MSADVERPALADVVEANRDTIELVAEGDDEVARMARNILTRTEDDDV